MKLSFIWLLRVSMLIKLLKVAVEEEIKACMNNERKVMVKTEDPCDDDDFDDPSLTDAQMKFANAFDINLRGQLR
ncbi:hypothetical protein Tco_1473273 [Tanacetum coccineum]